MTKSRGIFAAPLILGAVLLVAFIEAGGVLPYRATAGVALGFMSTLELRYWLAYLTLAMPGFALLAYGLAPLLRPRLAALWARYDALSPRGWWIRGAIFAALVLAIAVIGRRLFLLGLPITDDEYAVAFGARIVAHGHLTTPILQPDGAFTQLFTYRHAGMVTSQDYPGAVLFAAAAIVTHLGSLLYALAAAATAVFVVASAGVVAGGRGRLLAAALWLVSPMAEALAMTTHAQLVSRCFIAGAIYFYLRFVVDRDARLRIGVGLGLCGGLAFLTRSAETAAYLLPVLVHLAIVVWRDRAARRALLAAAAVAAAALVVYAWYNAGTTGTFYLPARFGPGKYQVSNFPGHGPLYRLGSNAAANWMQLAIMALGPIGALLAGYGVRRSAPWTVTLAASIGVAFALALAHDDAGIHSVGPIHYSEALPAVILLAVAGVLRLFAWLEHAQLPRLGVAAALAGLLVGAVGTQCLLQLAILREQASNLEFVLDTIASQVKTPAVVIGPAPQLLIRSHPAMRTSGSWVMAWPTPDPDLTDPILYVNPTHDPSALERLLPGRHFYRVAYTDPHTPIVVTPLD